MREYVLKIKTGYNVVFMPHDENSLIEKLNLKSTRSAPSRCD